MDVNFIKDDVKKITSILEDYWPSCDAAYFQGVCVDGCYSVDAFFKKDGSLFRKNLVAYYDLTDCHRPRNLSDQKIFVKDLMVAFKEFEDEFYAAFGKNVCVLQIKFYRVNNKPACSCTFSYDEHVLDELPGGAHELHQKYYEKIEKTLRHNN